MGLYFGLFWFIKPWRKSKPSESVHFSSVQAPTQIMATLLRRTASRLVGSCIKNRFSVNPFYNQTTCAPHGRLRHLTPSISRNNHFTTSARKRASSNDPLLRVIEAEIGFAEQADDYNRVSHLLIFMSVCSIMSHLTPISSVFLLLCLNKGWRNSKWFPFQNGRQTRDQDRDFD